MLQYNCFLNNVLQWYKTTLNKHRQMESFIDLYTCHTMVSNLQNYLLGTRGVKFNQVCNQASGLPVPSKPFIILTMTIIDCENLLYVTAMLFCPIWVTSAVCLPSDQIKSHLIEHVIMAVSQKCLPTMPWIKSLQWRGECFFVLLSVYNAGITWW